MGDFDVEVPFAVLVIGILLCPIVETIIDEIQESRDLRRKQKKKKPTKP